MGLMYIQSSTLTSLADAIRAKNGTSELMTVSNMISAINNITGGGATNLQLFEHYTFYSSASGGNEIAEIYTNMAGTSIETNNVYNTLSMYHDFQIGSIINIYSPHITSIPDFYFQEYSTLKTADFLACTSIGEAAFNGCTVLSSISFPVCTTISEDAFCECESLLIASFPVCTSIGPGAFYSAFSLSIINFPMCTTIDRMAFFDCPYLSLAYFPTNANFYEEAFANVLGMYAAAYNVPSHNFTIYLSGSTVGTADEYIFADADWEDIHTGSKVWIIDAIPENPESLRITNLSIFVPSSLFNSFLASWANGVYNNNIYSY